MKTMLLGIAFILFGIFAAMGDYQQSMVFLVISWLFAVIGLLVAIVGCFSKEGKNSTDGENNEN